MDKILPNGNNIYDMIGLDKTTFLEVLKSIGVTLKPNAPIKDTFDVALTRWNIKPNSPEAEILAAGVLIGVALRDNHIIGGNDEHLV